VRIRTIKPEFFLHEDLFELEKNSSLPVRVAFIGLWCAADREGRFAWQPRRLGAQILPYDEIDFSRVLDALTTRGFVVKYASGDGVFGYIPGFKRHQVINNRERVTEIPNPPDNNTMDACPTREPRVPHAGEGEGNKEQGTRNKLPEPPATPKVSSPKPKKEPAERRKLTDAFKEAYELRFEEPYLFCGAKDAMAADKLLASKLPVEEIIQTARDAWDHKDMFNCKLAISISGLASRWNEIRQELRSTSTKQTQGWQGRIAI